MLRNNRFNYKIEKAQIVPSMTSTQKRKHKKKSHSKTNSVKVVKGRVLVKVPGYKGLQKLAPSHLIQHISKKNIRSAASSVLRKGNKTIKRRYKKRKTKRA